VRLSKSNSIEADILGRVLQEDGGSLPKALLAFRFPQSDLDRMHELAVKNQEGKLSRAEQGELEAYCRVGRLLDLLSAKARLALHQRDLSA